MKSNELSKQFDAQDMLDFAKAYAKQTSLIKSESHYADLVNRIVNHAKNAPYEPYQEKLLRFIVDELEIIKRKLLPEPPKQ